MTKLTKAEAEFQALYVLDVQEYPETYKRAVRERPYSAAQILMHGLSTAEIKQMIRDLKAERREIKRKCS